MGADRGSAGLAPNCENMTQNLAQKVTGNPSDAKGPAADRSIVFSSRDSTLLEANQHGI